MFYAREDLIPSTGRASENGQNVVNALAQVSETLNLEARVLPIVFVRDKAIV